MERNLDHAFAPVLKIDICGQDITKKIIVNFYFLNSSVRWICPYLHIFHFYFVSLPERKHILPIRVAVPEDLKLQRVLLNSTLRWHKYLNCVSNLHLRRVEVLAPFSPSVLELINLLSQCRKFSKANAFWFHVIVCSFLLIRSKQQSQS